VSGQGKLYDVADLATSLAPALGYERADHVVQKTLAKLELPHRGLSLEQATRVLESIATTEGVVGIAGRFALARAPRDPMSVSGQFRTGLRSMTVGEMVKLFIPSVGSAKAEEVVASARAKLRIQSDSFTPRQVSDMLDVIVSGTGIVATVARFARARLLLDASEKEQGS
jgi:hypothetical protein